MPKTRTVSDIIRIRLVTPDGVKRAFCDQLCLDSFRVATFTTITDAVQTDEPRRIVGSCASCSWCGEIVARPEGACRWHEPLSCPDWTALASFHVQYAVRLLREQVDGPLTPRAWVYLTEHAEALRDCGKLDARDLYKFVIDCRIDWDSSW